MTTTLLILLAASVATGLLVGWLAEMEPKHLAAMCLLMCAASTGFWGLVALL